MQKIFLYRSKGWKQKGSLKKLYGINFANLVNEHFKMAVQNLNEIGLLFLKTFIILKIVVKEIFFIIQISRFTIKRKNS